MSTDISNNLTALEERLALVVELREKFHKTFKEIGQVIGVSIGRSRDLYHKAKRLQHYHANGANGNSYYGLSVRTANCVHNASLYTRDEIMSAVKDGSLHPNRSWCRNFGWKSYVELCRWLGLQEPQKARAHPKKQQSCPHCGGKL